MVNTHKDTCISVFRAAITKYPRWSGRSNRNLLSRVFGGCKSKSRYKQGWFHLRFVREGFVPDLSSWLGDSYFVLMFPFLQERREEREREREKEISSFYKATNPIGLGPHPMPSFNLSYLLKALFPNVVTLGVRTSALVGDTVQSIAVSVLCLGIQLPVCRAAAQ